MSFCHEHAASLDEGRSFHLITKENFGFVFRGFAVSWFRGFVLRVFVPSWRAFLG